MLHWTGGYLGPGGVREILPYPSTLVGYPIPLLSSSYPDTFKRKHDTAKLWSIEYDDTGIDWSVTFWHRL